MFRLPRASRSVLLLLMLVAVPSPAGNDRRFFKPALRTPSRFVVVSGELDPAFELKLNVEYQTTDKACRVTVDRFAGVSSPRIYQHEVRVERTGRRFSAGIPVDVVGEKTCDWRPWGVNYTVVIDGKPHKQPIAPTPLVWFREDARTEMAPFAVTCEKFRDLFASGWRCSQPGGDYFVSPGLKSLAVDFRAAR